MIAVEPMTLSRRAFLAAAPLTACGGGGDQTATIASAHVPPASDEFASLIAAAPAGGAVVLEAGRVYPTRGADATGKRLTIIAHGAVIQCNGAGLVKRDHGNKLTMLGGRFVGTGAAINLDMAPSFITSDDYRFDGIDFEVDANFAMRLVGAREGRTNACTFHGAGMYLRQTVSALVNQGIFIGHGRRTGVFYDGAGTGFDAGLVLDTCEIMGWDRGLDVRYTDWVCTDKTTVDYNESANVSLVGQDGATLGGYFGSKNTAPALHITGAAAAYSQKITVCAEFTGHHEGNDYDAIVIDGAPDRVTIAPGTHINFYTRYGIRYALTHGSMSVVTTTFAPRGGFGSYPIFNSGSQGDSGLLIADNTFPPGTEFAGSGITFAKWRDNRGLK